MTLSLHTEREFVASTLERGTTLIDPWMAPGSITLLFGPPSAGKTMMTLSMARALAAGTTLWGFPCTKSRVLIVQADMGNTLYHERLQASKDNASSNIHLLLTDGGVFDVLAQAAAPSAPVQAAQQLGAGVVFVDTLRRSHTLDENDSTTADRVYDAWRRLFPGSALVFLHHSRKLPSHPDAKVAVREAFRGTSAWAASADTLLSVRRLRRDNSVRVTFARTRGCLEPEPFWLKQTPELLLERVDIVSDIDKVLWEWREKNPKGERRDAIAHVTGLKSKGGNQLYSQATAYRAWDRVFSHGDEKPK